MRGRVGAVGLVLACFAFNSLATRYLVSRGLLDAAAVTIARFAAGAAMLLVVLAWQGRPREALPSRKDAGLVLLLGGYALAIAYGYRFITAAAGTFVFYALVVATMTFGGPRPSLRGVLGACLALAGVGVLASGDVAGSSLPGVARLALTGATWGGYSLLLRARKEPIATNARAFLGVALLLPLLAVVEWPRLVWSWEGAAIGVAMGAGTTALAYALWSRVLPTLAPIEAGTVQLLVPVLTAAAGVVALGEPFGRELLAAAALVLGGMALTTYGGRG